MNIKITTGAFSVLVAVALLPTTVFAATMQAGEEVLVGAGTTIEDNAYFAGGNISIASAIQGDLYTAGGNVLISDIVRDDVVAAGGSVTILGDTGGDVRVAGGNVLVAGSIGGELIAAGGSVTVAPEVTIGGDVVMLGGQLTLAGAVGGDVKLIGGQANVSGTVSGNVAADVEGTVTISDSATIDGTIVYRASQADALVLTDGAVVTGAVMFEQREPAISAVEAEQAAVAVIGAFLIGKVLAYIAVALILVWLFKRFSHHVVQGVVQNPLRAVGYGFVTLVVTPVAAVLLLVTLLGIPLAGLVLLAYGFLLLLASLYAGVVVGAWVSQLFSAATVPTVTYINATLGVLLLSLVKLVPVVGWVLGFLVFLLTLGSLAELLQKKIWTQRNSG